MLPGFSLKLKKCHKSLGHRLLWLWPPSAQIFSVSFYRVKIATVSWNVETYDHQVLLDTPEASSRHSLGNIGNRERTTLMKWLVVKVCAAVKDLK